MVCNLDLVYIGLHKSDVTASPTQVHGHHIEHGGLASTIGAKEPEYLPLFDYEAIFIYSRCSVWLDFQ